MPTARALPAAMDAASALERAARGCLRSVFGRGPTAHARGRWTLLLCALALIACGGAPAARAAGRTALVIANAAYPDSDAVLPTPIGDARAFGEDLKRRGFTVVAAENATREAMTASIDKFLRGIEPDGIALVFFSGYGIQAGRKNYLVPVDATIWSEADVVRNGVAVDGLMDEIAKRRAGIRVLVLDAARRNPFERRFRSFSQGLAPAAASPGTLTLYATAAGGVISEGGGPRSPFVTELIQQIGGDGTADQAFAAVRDALAKRTRNGQVPALAVNLDATFSFDPDRPRVPVAKATPDKAVPDKPSVDKPAAGKAAPDAAASAAAEARARDAQAALDRDAQAAREREAQARRDRERDRAAREREAAIAAEQAAARAFEAARAKGTAAAYQDFLDRHPTGPASDRARTEIARLDTETRAQEAREQEARAQEAARRRADQERQRLADLDGRIRRNPRDEAAFYERGQFHAQRGDASAAIADFDQAIRLNPASPEAFNNRCWMRAMADDLKRALTDCNAALKLRPGFLDALDSRGLVNLKAGAFQAAATDYGEALKVDPRHSSALYGRGLARKRLGDEAQARHDMADALELNPQIDKDFASYGLH
ncbi:caspase family protein [Methylobacterium sp. NEAU 140]|uniref:caspase family protein n=1 Tax=Methylobacterium sp. NEAU 140 TaxID=3064945 RepID=UPI0027370A11|nr:caspase family protein [Methylobacterium sp. NEAU 140]MDP4023314.1 caspase family protein [Methylobacterium sp. NEAU 140]